jgi:hypothetical protein
MDSNKSVEADNNGDKISLIADRTKAFVASASEAMEQLYEILVEVSDGDASVLQEQQTWRTYYPFTESTTDSVFNAPVVVRKYAEVDSGAPQASQLKESVLSHLEFQINQKLRSIDTHHAHIDSNREEIDYLGKETDALLESM